MVLPRSMTFSASPMRTLALSLQRRNPKTLRSFGRATPVFARFTFSLSFFSK
ncbi:MAG: hypothetical protein HY689_04565 [Chloroflexi bacterium]|nr:hypothetical protein [Chloroflexota bacterium]